MDKEIAKQTTSPCKRTIGEELFLVHLNRQTEADVLLDKDRDSDDQVVPRKRSRSIGEELFAVHLTRSQGMDPDLDIEAEEVATVTEVSDIQGGGSQLHSNSKTTLRKAKTGHPVTSNNDTLTNTVHVIHLRNRDVPVHASMVHTA